MRSAVWVSSAVYIKSRQRETRKCLESIFTTPMSRSMSQSHTTLHRGLRNRNLLLSPWSDTSILGGFVLLKFSLFLLFSCWISTFSVFSLTSFLDLCFVEIQKLTSFARFLSKLCFVTSGKREECCVSDLFWHINTFFIMCINVFLQNWHVFLPVSMPDDHRGVAMFLNNTCLRD